jgi:hypothetical protein
MQTWILGVVLLVLPDQAAGSRVAIGCRDTHVWVDRGSFTSRTGEGTVEVAITSGPGGQVEALPDALVIVARTRPFIEAYTTKTDSNGRFAFPGLPEGEWRLNVCRAGFQSLDAGLVVSAKAPKAELRLRTHLGW